MNGMEMWKRISSKHQSRQNFRNGIAKVYQIHAHGKFTVIVRSSYIRLHYTHPTTPMNPCYRFHFSSICSSVMGAPARTDFSYDRKRERTGKSWNSFYQKVRQMVKTEVTPTLIVHSCMFKEWKYDDKLKTFSLATTQTHLPVLIEQERSYTGLLVLALAVISILIIGGILWYIFARTHHSCKFSSHIDLKIDNFSFQFS